MIHNASIVLWVGCIITSFLASLELVDGNGPTDPNGKHQPLSKIVDNAKKNFGFDSNSLRKDGPLMTDFLQYVRDRPMGRKRGQSIPVKKVKHRPMGRKRGQSIPRDIVKPKGSVCSRTYIIAIGNIGKQIVRNQQLLKKNPCIILFQGEKGADLKIDCPKFKFKNNCEDERFFVNKEMYCKGNIKPNEKSPSLRINYTRSASLKKKKKPKIKCTIKAIRSATSTSSSSSSSSTSSARSSVSRPLQNSPTSKNDSQYCPDSCGFAPLFAGANRIVGGSDAKKGELPWMASIFVGQKACAGSIINSLYVLTAAHCFDDSPKDVMVGFGSLIESKAKLYIAKKYVKHPAYNNKTFVNDIALIKLKKHIIFNDKVSPICLAPDDNYTGKSAVVAGWGLTDFDDTELARRLQRVDVVVWNQTRCVKNYGKVGTHISNSQFCASDKGKDSCLGDSGAPLALQLGDRWSQIGIVSFGIGCANPKFPGVYVKPIIYKTFLDYYIKSGHCPNIKIDI